MPDTDPSQSEAPEESAITEEMVMAQMVQIASLCVTSFKQTKDDRIGRIKDAAIKELNEAGGAELLLQVLSQRQVECAPSRNDGRLEQMTGWQESMKRRTETQQGQREQMQKLQNDLLAKLIEKLGKS